jgi:WS/DGAT/MGAT family acyltransferase
MAEPLNSLDATFLELEEADESAHMHIGAIMVFGSHPGGLPPSLKALREHLAKRIPALPRYYCRLSETHTGGLRWPSWEQDRSFAIENHVRRAAVPAPGGEQELLEWAGDYWSQRLDRRRPLWEVVLLEGLSDGRWALATKTHHALVDGVGAVDVGHLVLDATPRPLRRELPVEPPVQREHGFGLASALASRLRGGLDVALHPRRLAEEAKAMVELLVRDELIAAPSTSLNVPIGARRRFDSLSVELSEIKAIKNALGGTVNDVVLAASAGGLRRLLLAHGDALPDGGLRVMVPVNVRAAEEHLKLGNKITSLFVHLPVAEPEPLRRYQVTRADSEELKRGDQARGSSTLVALTGMAPPVLHSVLARSLFAARLFNVTITNVPGPQMPLYGFGARLEQVLPLVPIFAGHAVGIAVVSYAGKMFFGLNADDRVVPDLHVLREGIADSLAELSELAASGRRGAAAAV